MIVIVPRDKLFRQLLFRMQFEHLCTRELID